MYEKDFTMYQLYYIDNIKVDTSTLGDAEKDDKEEREEIIYNAIDKYFSEHPIVINNSSVNTRSVNSSNDDLIEFSSSTDAKFYTVGVVGDAPTSSAQQTTLYLLDTRNILLIFALTWLCVTLYSKLKNLIVNYTTKN